MNNNPITKHNKGIRCVLSAMIAIVIIAIIIIVKMFLFFAIFFEDPIISLDFPLQEINSDDADYLFVKYNGRETKYIDNDDFLRWNRYSIVVLTRESREDVTSNGHIALYKDGKLISYYHYFYDGYIDFPVTLFYSDSIDEQHEEWLR